MTIFDHNGFAQRFAASLNAGDFEVMRGLVTDDFVLEWPQSNERVRGVDNFGAILDHFPGGTERVATETETLHAQAADAVQLVAPSYTFVAVEGAGNGGSMTMKVRYPDGSIWWAINLYRPRDNRMCSSTFFFAPIYPAPEWRAQWVERIG
jgi:hypothetical protein